MERPKHPFDVPRWAAPLLKPARFKAAYGGRGRGATTFFANLMVMTSLQEVGRYCACREFQSSIKVSSKAAIEKAIRTMNVAHLFKVGDKEIHGVNGSHLFFPGIERNPDSIKGWEDVRVCWVEEAHRLSRKSARLLMPTPRAPGSEIWASFNPDNRDDFIYERAVLNPRPNDIIVQANWRDNPWFPPELDEERRALEKEDPELYSHVWEGVPLDDGAEKRVLPYGVLNDCVELWHRYCDPSNPEAALAGDDRRTEWGFDIADTGIDRNAIVGRRAPVIFHYEQWRAPTVTISTMRCHGAAMEHRPHTINYDRAGIGSEARRTFSDLLAKKLRPYRVRPEQFGGKVLRPDRKYAGGAGGATNEDMFLRRNAQMAWVLRLRANNSRRLRTGERITPDKCLFIDPNIPRREHFLTQLCQPKWDYSELDRIRILKKEEGEPSPDLFDAACLAFASDSIHGIAAG